MGSGDCVAVADRYNARVCVFGLDGSLRQAFDDGHNWRPLGLALCRGGWGLLTVPDHRLVLLRERDGQTYDVLKGVCGDVGEPMFAWPCTVAVTPDGDVVVRERARMVMLWSREVRYAWIVAVHHAIAASS